MDDPGEADNSDTGPDDHRLAREVATGAGALLLAIRAADGFADPSSLRATGDRRAHECIVDALRSARPDDSVLSEEGVDDTRRLDARRVWIVDPLDGTREFAEEGRDDWAVHVALWADGALSAGAVALPALGVTLSTGAPGRLPERRPGPLRLVASRTRPPAIVEALRQDLGAELVPMGSAGAKVAAVVRGIADAYVHAGGQYEWDSAAPVAVAARVGLHVSRLDGSELRYNQRDPLLPDLVVCRPEVAAELLPAIARALAEAAPLPN